jgi:hypothetical protein
MLHAAPGTCPNCFAEIAGNFCHQCSQETTLHPPSTREFLHEFIGHYVALEGKLWKSLWLLMLKPGRLTLEYIQGRRVRYVQPLRLYLTFSLIFFAVLKLSGIAMLTIDPKDTTPAAVTTAGAPAPPLTAPSASEPVMIMDDEASVGMGQVAERLHAGWGAKVTRFFAQPKDAIVLAATKAFLAYTPYALFALMPVFALLLKLLYLGSGRRFGAHLLFALHANAFAFAMMALLILTRSTYDLIGTVLVIWMIVYLPLAMRRVYGGGWFVTLLRWTVLALLHLLCIALAILLTLSSAAVV